MGLFKLAGAVLDKKLSDHAQSYAMAHAQRVDTGLPFNAGIGSILEMMTAEFAVLTDSLLFVPDGDQLPIVAVSRIHLDDDDEGLALYRLWTELGLDRRGRAPPSFRSSVAPAV